MNMYRVPVSVNEVEERREAPHQVCFVGRQGRAMKSEE